ncbi:ankyrin repeat domain-containing protein [Dactylosporangium sp. NPDC005555]|uniref:ankyrin repeat domain-containing protein n=1 Tax=Dactylosporangium sp. NPDC005555 TaxID=3154889 RepID=UPI0033AF3AD9
MPTLLRHGADPDGVGTAHPVFEGLSARQLSTMYGYADLPQSDDPVLRFLGECMRGGPVGDPALAETAIRRRPHHLVAAASDGRTAAVRLMADLGFPLKGTDALHEAAHNGHLETVRALIELGADPDRREPRFHATPRGWAEHNGKRDVAEYLATVERSR